MEAIFGDNFVKNRTEKLFSDLKESGIKEEDADNEKYGKGVKSTCKGNACIYDEIDFEDEEDMNSLFGDLDTGPVSKWQDIDIVNSKPPNPLTVTHINQTHDLMKVQENVSTTKAEDQCSMEWLQTHSVEYLQITLMDLLERGKIGKLSPDHQTGKVTQHIQFDAYDVDEFEFRLNKAIEMYINRIKWLLQGSKRMFGRVTGERVAVCIDSSCSNLQALRKSVFQEALTHLLDEQLSTKKGLYMVSFGTELDPLWPVVRNVHQRIVEEANDWVMRLTDSGGSNLLKALKCVTQLPDIDTIVIILGSFPDQKMSILIECVEQMLIGKDTPIHTVAYDYSNDAINEEIYTGTDISVLLREIDKVQGIINKVNDMRNGLMDDTVISVLSQVSRQVSELPQSSLLPKPSGHNSPLNVEMPKFHPLSSVEWLKQHGLKAKRQDLYQILMPNAYSYHEAFVPIIKKAVQSQVNEKAMVQFTWHDGTKKNVHVEVYQLFHYQRRLADTTRLYEQRIDWLNRGSRMVFGTVIERNVVLLVDTSVSNVKYLIHIQHSIRLLLEQQMANKDYFNIVTFGGNVEAWKPTMVRATPENLQDAWRWVLNVECGGSRNLLSALRITMENDEEQKHHIFVGGVYIFTSGVPDQDGGCVEAFAEETASAWNAHIHTVLFDIERHVGNDVTLGRYANTSHTSECLRQLAHCTGGRFHWFKGEGIVESDDIRLINIEIDSADSFSQKCTQLVEAMKRKHKHRFPESAVMEEVMTVSKVPAGSPISSDMESIQPSIECKHVTDNDCRRDVEGNKLCQKLALHQPHSTERHLELKAKQMPGKKLANRRMTSTGHMSHSSRKKDAILSSHFFLEGRKHATGSILCQYPKNRCVWKVISAPVLPEKEKPIPTRDWMRKYSLQKLKLDLDRMVSRPHYSHRADDVKGLCKHVSAKYCDIFPTINIRGSLKHLHLLPHELREYQKHVTRVLQRYLRRLQWLLSGSRRMFGAITHKKVVLLVDTSGSMEAHMHNLKKDFELLVWEQLFKLSISFNIINFSEDCQKWRDCIQLPTEANCHGAIDWMSSLVANGNTCTLEAIKAAFQDLDAEAVYLISDGKPDTSTSLVLREVAKINLDRRLTVNTISLNNSDSTANSFLRLLARETGGRYHCHLLDDFQPDQFAHNLLSGPLDDCEYPNLPHFDGDDLRRLATEIGLARRFLQKAKVYQDLSDAKHTDVESHSSKS